MGDGIGLACRRRNVPAAAVAVNGRRCAVLPGREDPMARKPNYSFERHERERLKAEKKAKRAAAKKEAQANKSGDSEDPVAGDEQTTS
ncbi:MAG: hypothetical protein VW405_05345 [Rhodospirillaceae bacterium]